MNDIARFKAPKSKVLRGKLEKDKDFLKILENYMRADVLTLHTEGDYEVIGPGSMCENWDEQKKSIDKRLGIDAPPVDPRA